MNKEIIIAGRKISYRVYGQGTPVMLVHGFGETGDVWKASLANLQIQMGDKFMFIVPDLPGSGQSELIADMSMEGMAEVIKSISDHESIAPFILIGHSMGGYITLAFVEKYESHLSAFGLFHSSAFPDTDEKKAARRKGIEFIKEHGAFEFLKTSTPNLFSPHTKDTSPEMVSQFIQTLQTFSPEALISYYEAMINRPDRTAILKSTPLPVLFIMGEHDNAVPLQDGLKQCHWPSKASIHILHQSGHMGMMEEPEKTNYFLEQFFTAF